MNKALLWLVPLPAICAVIITTCQVAPLPQSVEPIATTQLRSHINASTQALVPNDPSNFNLFDSYSVNECLWARGWVGKLEFTGIAMDQDRTCTLISPRHILMAQHYQRGDGAKVTFHDRTGSAIVRLIEKRAELPGGLNPDIAVGLLDLPVPVPFFRVLPPREDYNVLLSDTLVLATDRERNLLPRTFAAIDGPHVRLRKAEAYADVLSQPLITGDSGNPSFVIVNGEPILIETHTYGGFGQGPFLSSPENYAGINQLMTQVGGGYQLTAIPLIDS